jgi:hypothetical protein
MKPSLMLLILLLIVTSAFRATGQYSKIEQFYTPVENGVPNSAKRQPYSESQFDGKGNLTKFTFIPYDSVITKHVETYKYENNRRVEKMHGGTRSVCTYNSNGDTLELKQFGYKQYGKENTVVQRIVFTYGSNGKKSGQTFYDGNSDSVTSKSAYTYNKLNQLIRHQYVSFLPEERVEYSAIYTYNPSGKVIKVDLDMPSLKLTGQSNYLYNDKGWIMESTTKYHTESNPIRHIYSYNADGLIIKEQYFGSGNEGIIDYVYTAR